MTTPNEARPEWKPVAWIRRDHLRHAQKAAFYCTLSATQLQPDQDPLYAPAVHTEMLRAQEEARVLREALEQWRSLYRQAINEANGLTNYVEDRPELRSAERKLEAIQIKARAIDDALKGTP